MREVFYGSEDEYDDHYDVTAFCEPDVESEEVTELIAVVPTSNVPFSDARVSFLSSLFRTL